MSSGRVVRAALVLAVLAGVLAGCGGGAVKDGYPENPVDVSSVPDAVPRVEPRSRYGNPRSYTVFGKRYYTLDSADGYRERGVASWYGTKFHGRRTSSGEPYDMYAMTAAHKTLPLPTYVRVTNLKNGSSVVVKVNDRGPFHSNRIIDLSYTAAHRLDILGKGTGYVEVIAIDPRRPEPVKTAAAATDGSGSVKLYLQTGAFTVRENAERMRFEMQSVYDGRVVIQPVQLGGSMTYRVRVGPIPSVTRADRLAEEIMALGHEEPRIVIE